MRYPCPILDYSLHEYCNNGHDMLLIKLLLLVPPEPLTATVRSFGINRAGLSYSLSCIVSKVVDGLRLINSPIATWSIGGEAISNSDNVSVSNGMNNGTTTLHFNPLKTSYHGRYICNGTLTSPALDTPLMSSTLEVLRVQSKHTYNMHCLVCV